MSWVTAALLASSISAVTNILDKTVIYRYARSPLTLPLLIGIAQTTVGLVVLALVRTPATATLQSVAWGIGSGVLFGLSGQLLIRTLFTQEVSRTMAIFQTFPIFAAIIGVIFLGETLSFVQAAGLLSTVAGAVTLSVRIDPQYHRLFFHRSFFLLMLGSLLAATAHVAGKTAVNDLPVLYTHGLRMLALGIVFLGFNLRPVPVRDVTGFLRNRSPALLFVAANEFIVANAGLLITLWALSLGPVSLVTALVGSRALFVLLYSTGIALVWKGFLGEETSRGAVAVKVGSTALIVAGVAGVSL